MLFRTWCGAFPVSTLHVARLRGGLDTQVHSSVPPRSLAGDTAVRCATTELLSIGVVGKDRVCAQLVIAALREPGLYVDAEEADRVVLVGPTLAWCHPVLYPWLLMVKALRPALTRGHRPRCTATCDHAATRARRVSDPVSAEWCGVTPRWPMKTRGRAKGQSAAIRLCRSAEGKAAFHQTVTKTLHKSCHR